MKSDLFRHYYRIKNSIGFYPTIISLAYFVFALAVIAIPSSFIYDFMKPYAAWLKIPKVWNAEVVLSTLITGIVSFITLSFAMVMVVLSNVSNTLSPKLVLGLVTEKTHQVVLGNYIGAILYCLILLLRISNRSTHQFEDMSIILAAAMGVWCLVLFIYFIHNISTSVQINTIVKNIYNQTSRELHKREKEGDTVERNLQTSLDEAIVPRYIFPSRSSGYLQKVDTDNLVKIAEKHDLVLRVHPHLGDYVVKGVPFFTCTKTAEQVDSTVQERIYDAFIFFAGENIEINEKYGFTQLMEIAVKALSPGINDPGIACICIDYLTDLFVKWTQLNRADVFYDQGRKPRLIVPFPDFEHLFTFCIGPIQHYGKGDLLIANKLLHCFKTLSFFDREDEAYKELLNEQARSIIEDIKNSLSNGNDLRPLYELVGRMNDDSEGYFSLPRDLN